jgi:hypothetical protein
VTDAGDRVFQPQPWGSWFEYAVPEVLVAIDSRIEIFPSEVWDAYERVVAGVDGWQAQLDEWGVDHVVVSAEQVDLRERLEGDGWQLLVGDADGALLRRGAGG